jgi:hypothetical protein
MLNYNIFQFGRNNLTKLLASKKIFHNCLRLDGLTIYIIKIPLFKWGLYKGIILTVVSVIVLLDFSTMNLFSSLRKFNFWYLTRILAIILVANSSNRRWQSG